MNNTLLSIDTKWKYFAIVQLLSEWDGEAAELFDKLAEADYGGSGVIFEEHNATPWEPFENWGADDLGDLIISFAHEAHKTEKGE
jgi:hypothetical protein